MKQFPLKLTFSSDGTVSSSLEINLITCSDDKDRNSSPSTTSLKIKI